MLMTSLGTLQAGSLLVVLSNPSQTGAPGDVLPFFGTMTNVSDTDTIFLKFGLIDFGVVESDDRPASVLYQRTPFAGTRGGVGVV
jgi:hypothetical protein